MKSATTYSELPAFTPGWLALLGGLGVVILTGLGAAYYMEHSGHWVTGMNNQVVWGLPHVFAVFLIVAASGALNVASVASVFGKAPYKPMARLSGLLALALLAGGLMVLVLDLGRPDRLIVAMTHFNFKSIFAWNVILYTGFFAVVGVYLWTAMDWRVGRFYRAAGLAAFLWRLILTTGTGSIFGFLVARDAFNSAVMAPLFIAMSLSFGTAIFLLVLLAGARGTGRPLGDATLGRLKTLLLVFAAAVLYFVAAQHLTNLYIAQRHGVERFLLLDGGIHPYLFWVGQVWLGGLVPIGLLAHREWSSKRINLAVAAGLIIFGGLCQMYVIIIGGQSFPLSMFPGKEVTSTFFDGLATAYVPTLPELLLGLGGVGVAMAIVVLGATVLRFLPDSLADAELPAEH